MAKKKGDAGADESRATVLPSVVRRVKSYETTSERVTLAALVVADDTVGSAEHSEVGKEGEKGESDATRSCSQSRAASRDGFDPPPEGPELHDISTGTAISNCIK